jgi:hypothetical protein
MKYWNKEFNWITDFTKGCLMKCYKVETVIGAHDGKVLELAISDLTKTIHNLQEIFRVRYLFVQSLEYSRYCIHYKRVHFFVHDRHFAQSRMLMIIHPSGLAAFFKHTQISIL